MLEAASSLDCTLLPPFGRDTYPDREFSSPLRHTLQRMFLASSGLVGQDMRHFGLIWCRGMQEYVRSRLFCFTGPLLMTNLKPETTQRVPVRALTRSWVNVDIIDPSTSWSGLTSVSTR